MARMKQTGRGASGGGSIRQKTGRRGARQSRSHHPHISCPAAGGGHPGASRAICTSPQGARPPRENVSHLLPAGLRQSY